MIGVRVALALAAVAMFWNISPSFAKDDMSCRLLEVRASNDEGGLDPALKALASKFEKPPFSSWKTFKLLKEHKGKVEHKKTMKVSMVTGGLFSLLHRGATASAKKTPRLRLTFTLDDKTGKRKLDGTINVDAGDYYLIGGDRLKDGGTYVLAVSCSL